MKNRKIDNVEPDEKEWNYENGEGTSIKTVRWGFVFFLKCSEWEDAVHEDDHHWCSSASRLGLCLFSILINSVGSKSRGALVGVPDD